MLCNCTSARVYLPSTCIAFVCVRSSSETVWDCSKQAAVGRHALSYTCSMHTELKITFVIATSIDSSWTCRMMLALLVHPLPPHPQQHLNRMLCPLLAARTRLLDRLCRGPVSQLLIRLHRQAMMMPRPHLQHTSSRHSWMQTQPELTQGLEPLRAALSRLKKMHGSTAWTQGKSGLWTPTTASRQSRQVAKAKPSLRTRVSFSQQLPMQLPVLVRKGRHSSRQALA